jgi:hypothetical protein
MMPDADFRKRIQNIGAMMNKSVGPVTSLVMLVTRPSVPKYKH